MRYPVLFSLAVAGLASPVLADHPAPAAIGGSAGAINLIAPDTLEAGMGAAGFRLMFTRPATRSDGELVELASHHVHAHGSDHVINASLGAAYGITDRLTVSAELPYVRHDDIRAGEHSHSGGAAHNRAVGLGSVAGIGDVTLLAKYKLADDPAMGAALIGGLKLPTGATRHRDIFGERLETEHQPGTGALSAIVGAAFAIRRGSLGLTMSTLYQLSGKGAQNTRLGDRFQGGIALSRRFEAPHDHPQPADHHHDDETSAHEHREAKHGHISWDAFVELTGEWEGRQNIMGEVENESGGKAVWLSPGARFNARSGMSVAVGVGFPVWQRIRASHPESDCRLTLSVGQSF